MPFVRCGKWRNLGSFRFGGFDGGPRAVDDRGSLGAWMAGSGYFALDASHPLERILQMTEDAAPGCLVTEKRHQSLANSLGWPSVMVEDLKEFDLRQGRPDKSLE